MISLPLGIHPPVGAEVITKEILSFISDIKNITILDATLGEAKLDHHIIKSITTAYPLKNISLLATEADPFLIPQAIYNLLLTTANPIFLKFPLYNIKITLNNVIKYKIYNIMSVGVGVGDERGKLGFFVFNLGLAEFINLLDKMPEPYNVHELNSNKTYSQLLTNSEDMHIPNVPLSRADTSIAPFNSRGIARILPLASFPLLYSFPNNFNIAIVDLGLSMYHFKISNRGFSFANPYNVLDMRADPFYQKLTAYQLLNTASFSDLKDIFVRYSNIHVKAAERLAETIISFRSKKQFKRVGDLLEVIRLSRYKERSRHIHNAFFRH